MSTVPPAHNELHNKKLLVIGSASPTTPVELLERLHTFVREATRQAWQKGSGFVVVASGDPRSTSVPEHSLVCTWTVLETIAQLATNQPSEQLRVVVLTAPKFLAPGKMPIERQQLLRALSDQGIARIEYIANDLWVGGRIREKQVSEADAMICLGGGKGIADLAQRLQAKHAPILPIDIDIVGIEEDGGGARQLYQELTQDPCKFLPYTGQHIMSRLFDMSLRTESSDIARAAAVAIDAVVGELSASIVARGLDVLLVTALPIELRAARSAFVLEQDASEVRSRTGTIVWVDTWFSVRSKRDVRVGLCCLGSAGNVVASTIVSELAAEFAPKVIVMIGIAAGMRGKRRLGEVVISEEVVAYEPAALIEADGKHVAKGRPRTWRTSHTIFQDVVNYLSQQAEIQQRIEAIFRNRGFSLPDVEGSPDVVQTVSVSLATIGSGEKLIRDAIVWEELRTRHGKIDVAEMEAVGIAAVCEQHQIPYLVIRGISDFGDSVKNDSYHWIAAVVAAEVAADIIRHDLMWNRNI